MYPKNVPIGSAISSISPSHVIIISNIDTFNLCFCWLLSRCPLLNT